MIAGQVPTVLNLSDVGTKGLTKNRLYVLMFEVGRDAGTNRPGGACNYG